MTHWTHWIKNNRWMRRAALALPLGAFVLSLGCAELDTLRTRTAAQDVEIARLRKENAEFQEAYYKTKESLQSDVASQQRTAEDAQRQLADAKNVKSQTEKSLGDNLRTRTLELEALRNESTEQKKLLDAQVAQLTQNLQSATAERDAALGKVTDLDKRLTLEQTHTKGLNDDVAKLKVDAQQQAAKLDMMQIDIAQRDALLKTEKEARAAAEQKIAASEKDLAAARKDAEDAKKEAADAQKNATDANVASKAAAAKSSSLEKQLAEASAAAKDLKTAQSEKTALTSQVEKLKAAVAVSPENDAALKEGQGSARAALDKAAIHKGSDVRLDKAGLRIILPSDLLFEKGSNTLSSAGNELISAAAPVVQRLAKGHHVRIEGHTDNQPIGDLPFADNWGLGFARADRVRAALMDAGVPGDAMTALTRAQFSPLKSNDTPENRAANRRVEIVIGETDK